MASPCILLSGFEPFDGESVNPSWLVAQALHGRRVGGARVVSVCLPCVFDEASGALVQAVRRHQPLLVLALGQGGGRAALSMERVAINVVDARIPDNAGAQPVDSPVVPGAPTAYFATLPLKAMLQALRDAGVPGEVSQSAGTFVCNHVFFALMHALATASPDSARAGFMHLPWLPEQAARRSGSPPSLPLATQVEGTRAVLKAALAAGA